jgi:hypothetical protein
MATAAAAVLDSEEAETLTLSDFQPSYEYSEHEIELVSLPDFLQLKYQNEVVKQVKLPSVLHQRYFASYRKDLKRKLEVLKPYLSGIESFLAMVLDSSNEADLERLIKIEIYRLP